MYVNIRAAGAEITPLLAISTATTGFFYDHVAASQLVRDVRWQDGMYCPRCKSKATKKLKSFWVNELEQCCDCAYNFNCTSGTVFQGSKLALNRHLQLFVALDLFTSRIDLKWIASSIGVSERTAKLQFEKLQDKGRWNGYLLGSAPGSLKINRFGTLLELLAGEGYLLDMASFRQRLGSWLEG